MKKVSFLLIVIFIMNILVSFPVYSETDTCEYYIIEQKIFNKANELNWDNDVVNKYLSEYDDEEELLHDMTRYQLSLNCYPEETGTFDEFISDEQPEVVEDNNISMEVSLQSEESDNILLPEHEVKDASNYSTVNENEKIDPITGRMIYEEVDLYLPGVNGLDFTLISRFISDESEEFYPRAIPGDIIYQDGQDVVFDWNTRLHEYTSMA